MEKIRARHIVFGYTSCHVLHDVSLRVHQGEVVSLLGPNGSGKTSLLKILLGLRTAQSGEVHIEGHAVTSLSPRELARRVAYVPQVHRMAFAYHVQDVVLMGRMAYADIFGRVSGKDLDIAQNALKRLRIDHLADASYGEISGGERQLTLIARALAQGARILILDEPLNGLDYGNQIRVLEHITRLAAEGYTFIKTTHFPDHALWMATRVLLLHQGSIVADGPPSDVLQEATLSHLYQADIAMVSVAPTLKACLPRSVLTACHATTLVDARA